MVHRGNDAMSTKELLAEIQKLSIEEQQQILEALTDNVVEQGKTPGGPKSEAEFERVLPEKLVITEIPAGVDQEQGEDDSEPITVKGKPVVS
jgi:hypothetical protein